MDEVGAVRDIAVAWHEVRSTNPTLGVSVNFKALEQQIAPALQNAIQVQAMRTFPVKPRV